MMKKRSITLRQKKIFKYIVGAVKRINLAAKCIDEEDYDKGDGHLQAAEVLLAAAGDLAGRRLKY